MIVRLFIVAVLTFALAAPASPQMVTFELKDLRIKLEGSDAQVLELQAALASRTASVELEKAHDRLRLAQKTETRYQNNVANLEEECAALRRILKTNNYDLAAVDEIVSKIKIKEIE